MKHNICTPESNSNNEKTLEMPWKQGISFFFVNKMPTNIAIDNVTFFLF